MLSVRKSSCGHYCSTPRRRESRKNGDITSRRRRSRQVIEGLRDLCSKIIRDHGDNLSMLEQAGNNSIEKIEEEEVRVAYRAKFPLVLGFVLKRMLSIASSRRKRKNK